MLRFHRQTTPYQHGSWSASQSQNRLWSAFNKYWDIWPSCTHLQSWRTLWMLLTQRLPWELRWPKSKDGLGLWDVLLSGMSHFFNFENSLSHCLLLVSIFGAIRYNRQTRELTPKSSCLQWMLSWLESSLLTLSLVLKNWTKVWHAYMLNPRWVILFAARISSHDDQLLCRRLHSTGVLPISYGTWTSVQRMSGVYFNESWGRTLTNSRNCSGGRFLRCWVSHLHEHESTIGVQRHRSHSSTAWMALVPWNRKKFDVTAARKQFL